MNEPQKITIFIVSLITGGAERVVSVLLRHLPPSFEVHLVLLNDVLEYDIPPGQRIHYLDRNGSKNPFLNILKIPLLSWKYRQYLKKHAVTTSFSLLPRPNFIALFSRFWGYKGRIIISERQYTSYHYGPRTLAASIGRWLVKWLYPKANLLICNSTAIAADLRQNFGINAPAVVIQNPVDLEQIARLGAGAPPPGGVFTFVTAGRLSAEKNHLLLIEACALLPDCNIVIRIAGKGPLEKFLQHEIESKGLQQKVQLEGHTGNPFYLFRQAHCFILPSHTEGFPNALLEAMACGLPVIATDCKSGPSDILRPDVPDAPTVDAVTRCTFGLLVPPGDAQQLAAAMQLMYENAELRSHYSRQSLLRSKEFSAPYITRLFAEVLQQS